MPLPEIVLPEALGSIIGHLPAAPPRIALTTALNAMLKRGLLPAEMESFDGRKFEIRVLDARLHIRFTANGEKFIARSFEGEPDLRLSANGIDFMRMIAREEDPDTLFFNRKLQIEGDTELGLMTKNLLDSVDWSALNPFQTQN